MKTTKTTLALGFAFLLGTFCTSFMSGCQQTERPSAEVSPDAAEAVADSAVRPSPPPITTVSEQAVSDNNVSDNNGLGDSVPVAVAYASAASVDPGTPDPTVKAGDWSQWGGNSYRNNTPIAGKVPINWDIGRFDRKTGEWFRDQAENIKWVAPLGSQTYGNAVIADGRIYCGTNNGAGYLARYPSDVDLGCLICLKESDGGFLWQHSSEKLPTGRVHDWPLQGICCAPLVEGNRVWFVSSRGEVLCLDAEGFHDGEDDGKPAGWGRLFDMARKEDPAEDQVAPALAALNQGSLDDVLRQNFAAAGAELPEGVAIETVETGRKFALTAAVDGVKRKFELRLQGPNLSGFKLITPDDKSEADEIWTFDMMTQLGVSQHNMCSCSVTACGDILYVNTSNGLDESHINLPAPDAPSFIAMNKNTGEVLWTDKSPGRNILHGQWSSPAVGIIGDTAQVIFTAGDGWVYSFKADAGKDGKPELLWKFDANPKTSKWVLGGRGTRNNIIATPVIHEDRVYVAVGQDPEHGEGIGHLWCIDGTKRGDISPQLAMRVEGNRRVPIPHKRLQAVVEEEGEVAVDNPNSAVVWHYSEVDRDGDGKLSFEETMHRSCGTVAIKDDLLYISDFSGLFHCLDARTGEVHWTYDMLAAAWGSPLIVNGHVYIGDEDGDVCVFKLTAEPHDPISEINMDSSVYSTPVVANDVLYISTKNRLFAIVDGAE